MLLTTRNTVGFQNKLARIEQEQRDIQNQIRELKRRFRELERQKKTVLRSIERVERKLNRIGGASQTNASMRRKVEQTIYREGWMEKIIENRFRSQAEHGPGSRKWARLSPVTIKRKGFNRILFETGEMYHGALQAVAGTWRLGQRPRWDVGKIGVDYAEYHQTGTDRMPARPFFDPPNDKELAPVIKRAEQLLRAEIRKAGA